MQTVIYRNEDELQMEDVISAFKSVLNKNTEFEKSEIEELVEIYAKNPTDKFIVTGNIKETFERQGDILIWPEGSEMYNREISRVKDLTQTTRYVLQKGDSMTGDHRLVPLRGSKVVVQEGRFAPSFLEGRRGAWATPIYDCILVESSKPFLIVHREHGNMALPAGKYMVCSQMDSETFTRMLD